MDSICLPRNSEMFSPHMTTIECPECGFEFIHMGKITVAQNDRRDEIWRGGLKTTFGNKVVGRGAVVEIEMEGECGHRFVLALQFHKGCTYIAAFNVRDSVSRFDVDELWRD